MKYRRSVAPLVSIVIPVFNRDGLLMRALESVERQEFRNFEVVLVDDGSADDPAATARKCAVSNLRLIRHPRNRGASASRNSGIAAAKGSLIAFLDSDDEWLPNKLALQVAALESSPQSVGVCATGYHLHKRGRHLRVCPQIPPGAYRSEVLFGCTISPGSTLLVRTEVFEKVGNFDETLRRLEDWDWLLRLTEHYDLAFIGEPLARIHQGDRDEVAIELIFDQVLESARRIEVKHGHRIRTRGTLAWRKFRSTILLEIASQMHGRHRPLRAAAYVAASLSVYPFRNVAFFATLWRSSLQLVRKRPAAQHVSEGDGHR